MYLRCPPDGGRYVGGRYGWPVDRRWRRGTSATTVNWRPGTAFPIPVPQAVCFRLIPLYPDPPVQSFGRPRGPLALAGPAAHKRHPCIRGTGGLAILASRIGQKSPAMLAKGGFGSKRFEARGALQARLCPSRPGWHARHEGSNYEQDCWTRPRTACHARPNMNRQSRTRVIFPSHFEKITGRPAVTGSYFFKNPHAYGRRGFPRGIAVCPSQGRTKCSGIVQIKE